MLSPEQRKAIHDALFSGGIYQIVMDIIDERMMLVDKNLNLSGDMFKDMPGVYRRDGALGELNRIRSLIKKFKTEYQTEHESLDSGQAEQPVGS